jgi:uncharacterized protein (TIGR02001 family)
MERDMFRPGLLLAVGLLAIPYAYGQTTERDLGDFDLKIGTTPARTMAQGLVQPAAVGSFHGGLDVTHESGFYAGQWAPSVNPDSTLEIDSYAGFKHPFDANLGFGYEAGIIKYSYPQLENSDSHEVYAGLKILDTRFGAAFNNAVDSRNSTLFASLGGLPVLNADMSVKVTNHQLTTPYTLDSGGQVASFNDWSLQLSREWKGTNLDFIYTDSSLRGEDCGAYSGHYALCEGVFTVQAVRAFF